MDKQYKIAALPGEGIAIEVVAVTLTILQQTAARHNFFLQIDFSIQKSIELFLKKLF